MSVVPTARTETGPADEDAPTEEVPIPRSAAGTAVPPGLAIPPPGDDTPWRSLHPASLAVNLLPQAWRTVRGAWPLLLALFFGGAGMGVQVFDLSLLLAFFAVALTRTSTPRRSQAS